MYPNTFAAGSCSPRNFTAEFYYFKKVNPICRDLFNDFDDQLSGRIEGKGSGWGQILVSLESPYRFPIIRQLKSFQYLERFTH